MTNVILLLELSKKELSKTEILQSPREALRMGKCSCGAKLSKNEHVTVIHLHKTHRGV